MSRFAPVAPLALAELLRDHQQLGSYHLLLAHDVLLSESNSSMYALLYDQGLRTRIDRVVIMDNSVVELGVAMGAEPVMRAAEIANADFIVAADLFLDAEETKRRATAFADEAYGQTESGIMGVVQGRTIQEVCQMVDFYADDDRFEAIAVPRCLTAQLGSRMAPLQYINNRHKGRFELVHMLGFSDNLMDDFTCARLDHVDGIDSAAPLHGAMKGIALALPNTDFGARGMYWHHTAKEFENAMQLIQSNLQLTRTLVRA